MQIAPTLKCRLRNSVCCENKMKNENSVKQKFFFWFIEYENWNDKNSLFWRLKSVYKENW